MKYFNKSLLTILAIISIQNITFSMNPMTQDQALNILGLNNGATLEQINSAYRQLALQYHPDKQGEKTDQEKQYAEQKFRLANDAYSFLTSNPDAAQSQNDIIQNSIDAAAGLRNRILVYLKSSEYQRNFSGQEGVWDYIVGYNFNDIRELFKNPNFDRALIKQEILRLASEIKSNQLKMQQENEERKQQEIDDERKQRIQQEIDEDYEYKQLQKLMLESKRETRREQKLKNKQQKLATALELATCIKK